jgi:hypothetical protein
MVDEAKKTQYWCIALIIIFVIMVIITYLVSGGFAALGSRILLPILNEIFTDPTINLIVQGVISVIVVIILVVCLWFGRKKEWF